MAFIRTTRSCTYNLVCNLQRSSQADLPIGTTLRSFCTSQTLKSSILNTCNFQLFSAIPVQRMVFNTLHKGEAVEDTPELRECFQILDRTSESFAARINQLQPEPRVAMCLLFLITRGLDNIEDDMTIPLAEKVPLLLNFHKFIGDESWTYNGNSPEQKDREILVKFDVISKEFNKIKEEHRNSIKDCMRKMGKGMSELVQTSQQNPHMFQTTQKFDMYCELIGGIEVMMDLTGVLTQSQLELAKPLEQLMSHTDHILDFRLDFEDNKYLWPKEVWGKYVNQIRDLTLLKNKEKALQCQSEMIAIALRHVLPWLTFFPKIKEPSAFKFFAGSQSMSMSILEFCFQNYSTFQDTHIRKDLKVRPFENFQMVCESFRECAQNIRQKNLKRPHDPNFVDISIVCNQIEKLANGELPSSLNASA